MYITSFFILRKTLLLFGYAAVKPSPLQRRGFNYLNFLLPAPDRISSLIIPYPQFARNCTPQNDNFFIFRVILNQRTFSTPSSFALKMKKFSRFDLSRVRKHKICAG